MRFPFNFSSLAKSKKLYLTFCTIVFLLFLYLFFNIKFNQDFSKIIPDTVVYDLKLFQSSPLSDKVFVVVYTDNPDADISQTAEDIKNAVSERDELGMTALNFDLNFLTSYYEFFPNLWDAKTQKAVEPLLSNDSIKNRFTQSIETVLSPFGAMGSDLILMDPLGLTPLYLEKLKNFDFVGNINFGSDSQDEKLYEILIFNYSQNFLDLDTASNLKGFFEELKKSLIDEINVFYIGPPRYTTENSEMIKSDIFKVSVASIVLMCVMFLILLKDKRAILIYAVPAIVVIVSSCITSFIFGGMSIITLGFGGVLMGLSVDYTIYVYFALAKRGARSALDIIKQMARPIFASAATSIITFLLLLFSGIEVFRQVAVFCAVGLVVAAFVALFVAPFIFVDNVDFKVEPEGGGKIPVRPFSRRTSIIVLILIILCAHVCAKFVKINTSLEALNYSSAQLKQDRAFFDKISASREIDYSMFFVFADSPEAALKNNEILYKENSFLKLAELFPSQSKREENVKSWNEFWGAKTNLIKSASRDVLKQYNIKPGAFDGYYESLGNASAEGENILEEIYNPVVAVDDEYAFVNIISTSAQVQNLSDIKTAQISNNILQSKIADDVVSRFTKIMIALLACSFLALSFIFKSVRLAFAAILPAIIGICAFFICSAIFGFEINLIGLYGLPLLIGLGADYGVFMIYQSLLGKQIHPLKAVVTAAVSTLIGFGSLMIARHDVLNAIGFMVFTGILASILASIFILPSLIKGRRTHD
jgi:predicted exporter